LDAGDYWAGLEACGEHVVKNLRAEDAMAKKKDLPSKKDVKGGYKRVE
jgi:hypothetical protein